MASRSRRSAKMKFFEEHTFGNDDSEVADIDKIDICEIASTKHANITDVVPRKKGYGKKRSFSDFKPAEGEGTSTDFQMFNNQTVDFDEDSEAAELLFNVDDNVIVHFRV